MNDFFKKHILSHNLNRYVVEMVKPDKCIRYMHLYNKEAEICDGCFLCVGDKCVYETVVVDLAKGEYETHHKYDKPRDYHFEQFCCPNCNELISQQSERIIIWTSGGGGGSEITCDHCKTQYVCIEDNFEKEQLTLARKVSN